MYYYIKTEPGLWTVGIGEGDNWQPESDWDSKEEASERVILLNGGTIIKEIDEELVGLLGELSRFLERQKEHPLIFNTIRILGSLGLYFQIKE